MMKSTIDWTTCDGRGLCTELPPELLDRDDWGYPVPREAGTGRPGRPAGGGPAGGRPVPPPGALSLLSDERTPSSGTRARVGRRAVNVRRARPFVRPAHTGRRWLTVGAIAKNVEEI